MNPEPVVLVADDEAGILRLLRLELSGQGFQVITATSGHQALDLLEEQRPDVVILDIMMPDMSGLEVMRRSRQHTTTPIILLTARGSDRDRVNGLELGADDYIVKPFNLEELAARVRAVLRRSEWARGVPQIVRAGDVEINLDRRLAIREGEPLPLTRHEWLLLHCLAANAGKAMLSNELLGKVWGAEYYDEVQYLRVWISRLRHKLEKDPANPVLIKTLPGIGYMLVAEPDGERGNHLAASEAPLG